MTIRYSINCTQYTFKSIEIEVYKANLKGVRDNQVQVMLVVAQKPGQWSYRSIERFEFKIPEFRLINTRFHHRELSIRVLSDFGHLGNCRVISAACKTPMITSGCKCAARPVSCAFRNDFSVLRLGVLSISPMISTCITKNVVI